MPVPPPDLQAPFPTVRLLVLAGAIFASVSSEFLPTGLLPEIADGLGVGESRVGLLVSVFAGTVALTSIPVTLATQRFGRKRLLVVGALLLSLGELIAVLTPGTGTSTDTRVLVLWTGQIIAGIGAAALFPTSLAMVAQHLAGMEAAGKIRLKMTPRQTALCISALTDGLLWIGLASDRTLDEITRDIAAGLDCLIAQPAG